MSPKRKRRFGAAIWFGNPRFITQESPANTDQPVVMANQSTVLGNVPTKYEKHTKRIYASPSSVKIVNR